MASPDHFSKLEGMLFISPQLGETISGRERGDNPRFLPRRCGAHRVARPTCLLHTHPVDGRIAPSEKSAPFMPTPFG